MDMAIHIMTPEERKYTYTQSQQIISQTGCIGHLRGYFGIDWSFYTTWEDHRGDLKTTEFKQALTKVINTLRFAPVYVDKHNCIIQAGDTLRYEDGTLEEVFALEDGSLGHNITNPDYLKHHPDAEEEFSPLTCTPMLHGVWKLHSAVIEGLENPETRRNSATVGTILKSREAILRFFNDRLEAGFSNHQDCGIRVDTKEYSFLMRLNPHKDNYNLYCYCYRRDWLEQHMANAQRGIRFIDPHYRELFRIPDGDMIRIIMPNGVKSDREVRYIDEYHVEIGGSFGCDMYHICEFAERMEYAGNEVIPLRSSLPEKCFVYVESTDEIGIVERGEMGYLPADVKPERGVSKRQGVEYLNDAQGVTKAQAAAMSAGSMFGWATKAADPANYGDQGEPQKPKRKDRGDAIGHLQQ